MYLSRLIDTEPITFGQDFTSIKNAAMGNLISIFEEV